MRSGVFTQTLTSGQTLPTDGVNLSQVWNKLVVLIPSMVSGSVQFYGATSSGATYYPITTNQTSGVVATIFTVDSAVVANGCIAELNTPVQFLKCRSTSGATDIVKTFQIICSENY